MLYNIIWESNCLFAI